VIAHRDPNAPSTMTLVREGQKVKVAFAVKVAQCWVVGSGVGDGARNLPKTNGNRSPCSRRNIPHRLVAIERLRESGEPAYRAAQMFMVVRYRALQQMKEHDPDLYTERVKGLLLEDKVFGAVEDGHAKPEATEEQRNALRDDVKELVSFNLRERADRLERLAQVLETERKKLDDDQNREEELADEKMHAIERDGVKAFQLEGGRRGRGDREGDRGPGPWPEPGGPPPPPAQ